MFFIHISLGPSYEMKNKHKCILGPKCRYSHFKCNNYSYRALVNNLFILLRSLSRRRSMQVLRNYFTRVDEDNQHCSSDTQLHYPSGFPYLIRDRMKTEEHRHRHGLQWD